MQIFSFSVDVVVVLRPSELEHQTVQLSVYDGSLCSQILSYCFQLPSFLHAILKLVRLHWVEFGSEISTCTTL